MKNILILLWKPLSKHKIEILEIESLKKFYKVNFCEITKIIFPKYKKTTSRLNFKVTKIQNFKALIHFFNKNSFDLILNHTGIQKNTEVYKLLLRQETPILTSYENFISKNLFYPYKFLSLFKNFIFSVIFFFLKKKKLNEYSYLMSDKIENIKNVIGTNIIYGQNYAINEISKIKNKKKIIKNKVVFLDQNWGDNTDYDLYYDRKSINRFKKIFYKELILFLKKFEKEFNAKITVSLHPFSKKKNWIKYKDFNISINKTTSEIASSNLTIGLWSNSLSYAILLKKNILIINSKSFLNMTDEYNYANYVTRYINSSMPLSISESNSLHKDTISKFIIKPNNKYTTYKNFFLQAKNSKSIGLCSAIRNILSKNKTL